MKGISFVGIHPQSRFFYVRSYYRILLSTAQLSWKLKVRTKVSFFLWTATLGRTLTTDNLRRGRVVVIDWWCMCKKDGETTNHLLMHCPIARELWNLVFIIRVARCSGWCRVGCGSSS